MASSDEETDFLEAAARENAGPSTTDSPLFLAIAVVTAAIPIYLYAFIFDLPLTESLPIFFIVTAIAAYILSLAYKSVAQNIRKKLVSQRDGVVTLKSVMQETGTKGEAARSLVKKKKDEIFRDVNRESAAHSIFYNNLLFLGFTVVMGTFIFRSTPTALNYVLSVSLSAALLTVTSTAV